MFICRGARGVFSRTPRLLQSPPTSSSSGSSKRPTSYAFFEDAYPKAKPAARVASYEEQLGMATVKNMEPRRQLTESEKLHALHEYKLDEKKGFEFHKAYGWAEEWGPEPNEEGHDQWYEKPKDYMNSDESFRYNNNIQTPLPMNHFRHQEMPYGKRLKAAANNMANENGQFFDTRSRDAWSHHTPEEKHDYVGKAKEEFIAEWMAKPGVTHENLTTKIAEYNGSTKGKSAKPVERVPDWELSPRKEFED
jgi:hypothetical protein